MKQLSNEQVNYLLGYRKETATLVQSLLKDITTTEVGVSFLHNRLDELVEDAHRLADAKKMVRVMAVTLNESDKMKQLREKVRKLDRKPLSEVLIKEEINNK